MNVLLLLASTLLLNLFSVAVSADETASVRKVLDLLAAEHGFEILGAEKLGDELVLLNRSGADVDSAVTRALARYNHVIRYSQARVRVVEVLGRKGTDPGPMPESQVAEADVTSE